MVLPPVHAGLSASIKRLYDVFAMYKQPAQSHSSPFSGITEQHKLRLYSKPLRNLTEDDLSMYARHAMTTWGDIEEYKHYLPRLYELLVVHPGWTDTELLIGRLDTAEWSRWAHAERDVVIAFLHELWAWSLTIDPDVARCWDILQGFGLAGIDPDRAIMAWRMDRSRCSTRQIAVLLFFERDALVSHGALDRQWMSPVREKMLKFLLDEETETRLRTALSDKRDQSGVDEIRDAINILALVRGA